MRPLSDVRAAIVRLGLLACAAGCDVAATVSEVDAVGFVDASGQSDDVGSDVGSAAGGCSLVQPAGCAADEGSAGCCAAAAPRCVPGIDGTNRCVSAGDVAVGEPCDPTGSDDCVVNAICASDAEMTTCMALCTSDADCPIGACTAVGSPSGQVGVCEVASSTP